MLLNLQHQLDGAIAIVSGLLLLLILLTLGAKWSKLDFITKLLVLSLLIHLLLLIWMSRVEIIRQFKERQPDIGTLQVNLVSQSAARNDTGLASDRIVGSARIGAFPTRRLGRCGEAA